jgi:hypothetical protein
MRHTGFLVWINDQQYWHRIMRRIHARVSFGPAQRSRRVHPIAEASQSSTGGLCSPPSGGMMSQWALRSLLSIMGNHEEAML